MNQMYAISIPYPTMHERWLHASRTKLTIVTLLFIWATGAFDYYHRGHPIVALALGLILLDYIALADTIYWLRRIVIAGILLDIAFGFIVPGWGL